MEVSNQEFIQEIIRLTWRNPAFMAIAIALVWLMPQLFIRKIMAQKFEQRKLEIQKNKIQKLYPTNTPK
jgi:cell division protein FtsN